MMTLSYGWNLQRLQFEKFVVIYCNFRPTFVPYAVAVVSVSSVGSTSVVGVKAATYMLLERSRDV